MEKCKGQIEKMEKYKDQVEKCKTKRAKSKKDDKIKRLFRRKKKVEI